MPPSRTHSARAKFSFRLVDLAISRHNILREQKEKITSSAIRARSVPEMVHSVKNGHPGRCRRVGIRQP
jgi:hypothetical protein